MAYYTMKLEIYEKGRYLRKKSNDDLVIVEYVEISTKGGKLVYKVHTTSGEVYDADELWSST